MRTSLPVTIASLVILLLGNMAVAHAEHAEHAEHPEHPEHHRLLLVTSAENKISPLDRNELRRLFLGMPVYRSGKVLNPLLNKTDERCYQIFLQSVIGMSQKRYERTLVLGLYRQGYNSPPIYTQLNELQAELNKRPDGVSFVHDNGQLKETSFNIVQEIWISDTK